MVSWHSLLVDAALSVAGVTVAICGHIRLLWSGGCTAAHLVSAAAKGWAAGRAGSSWRSSLRKTSRCACGTIGHSHPSPGAASALHTCCGKQHRPAPGLPLALAGLLSGTAGR